ncbi:hypothetical protein AUTU_27060 [Aureibacter tunicatorum]|nr:hypothetical protein AUTU_27060 [Aureibacter tunicatorum]
MLVTMSAHAQQNDQQNYLNAKALMKNGQYGLAMSAFSPLTEVSNPNTFQKYACFYYAYCAYEDNDRDIAKNMFLQITKRYPKWDKLPEAYFYLMKIELEKDNFSTGLSYFDKIKKSTIKHKAGKQIIYVLQDKDYSVAKRVYDNNPENVYVGKALANKIADMPISTQDRTLLVSIVDKFDFNKASYGLSETSQKPSKKSSYNVAVMLPFLYEEATVSRRKKDFIYEMYEGMLLAQEELSNDGIDLRFYSYDTDKNYQTTKSELQIDKIKNADLIVGPLYSGPVEAVRNFSFNQKVNAFNPVSNSLSVVGNNPYSFLFMPSVVSEAKAAANFASEEMADNRNCMIFYGTSKKDSLLAATYREKIQDEGFVVAKYKKFHKSEAQQILKLLTAKTEVRTDSLLKNGKRYRYDSLHIASDSIGHIFVASDDQLLAGNSISGISSRPDNIKLIGKEKWLQHKFLSLQQFNQNAIYLIAPRYVDYSSETFKSFANAYNEKYFQQPTTFSALGYDFTYFIGNMLHEYGVYFQNSFNERFIPGKLFVGYKYDHGNDNQFVPIIRMKDGALVNYNLPQ